MATGTYALADLERLDPWWALEALPEAEEFAERLGIAAAKGSRRH